MAYTNIWSSAAPLGSADPRTIDDEIRKCRLDFEERIQTIIGLADATNGITKDPVLNGSSVKSLNALTTLVSTAVLQTGPFTVNTYGRLLGSIGTNTIKETNGIGFSQAGNTCTLASEVLGLLPHNFDWLVTADNTGTTTAVSIDIATGLILSGAGTDYFHMLTFRSPAGFKLINGAGTVSFGTKLIVQAGSSSINPAIGKQIMMLFWYDNIKNKSYEIIRSAETAY